MESFSSSCLSESIKTKTYRTIILPIVSYVCETWSLTLREKCRLRVFKNEVLKKMFRPKRDEETRQSRRLHNEGLYNLYSPPILFGWSNQEKWGMCAVYHLWGRGGVHMGFWWWPDGRRPLGRPRHRWEDNIKMDLREVVGWGAWAGLIWLRIVVSSCECGNEPLESIKGGEFLD